MASLALGVKFIPASAGAGSFVFAAAVLGYLTPAGAGMVDGKTYRYRAENPLTPSEWEWGSAVYTASSGTFTRVVAFSSTGGAVVAFSGSPQVGIVFFPQDLAPINGYINGLTLSTAGASASFGVAVGAAADSSAMDIMALTSAMTKTTGVWTLGTAGGALDAGVIAANTSYHVYLIKRPDTGVVDVCVSLSAASPNISTGFVPSSYTLFRRIGSMRTDGSSQWGRFIQDGDDFSLFVPVVDVTAINPGTSAVTRTITSVPTGIRVKSRVQLSVLNQDTGAAYGYLSDLSVSDDNPNPRPSQTGQTGTPAGSVIFWVAEIYVYTNTSAQVRSRINFSTANITIYITTMGWTDTRGK